MCFVCCICSPTFVKICKGKSVAEFKPDPYVMTLLKCAMWVFYGLPFVKSHSILVSTINGIGFVTEAMYVTLFFVHSDWRKRVRMIYNLHVHYFYLHDFSIKRALIVDVGLTLLNGLFIYLFFWVQSNVIKTESVKYLPFYLSLANLLNIGTVWVCYASLKFDYNVVASNAAIFFSFLEIDCLNSGLFSQIYLLTSSL
ncbi:unnamed protein product [Coffea canephora]|uniref:Bidirectional sugar transporter SWEET n=1 Tax=Coffea canephora TaxID=49390 RepID=A0A068V3B3_COFCA|nr:unnamed protein product [Coffea canephora]